MPMKSKAHRATTLQESNEFTLRLEKILAGRKRYSKNGKSQAGQKPKPKPKGKVLQIKTLPAFRPLDCDARYKGAKGGRGSAKSWFFADSAIQLLYNYPNTRFLCVREVQRSLQQSVKLLLEDRIKDLGVGDHFKVLNTHIECGNSGRVIFQGMSNQTAESVKSFEGYDVAWVEEAQSFSQRSLDLLRPTIRKPGSQLWFSWNPMSPKDPVDAFFLKNPPKDAVSVHVSYEDNIWFPEVLRNEMEYDKRRDPDKYAHIWLGHYQKQSQARVFKNWQVDEFEEEPGARFYFGADWGFSRDPTVLIRCWIKGRTLFVDHEAYRVGCEIDQTPQLFNSVPAANEWPILADSARPETISYMQRHGFPKMVRAKKGPNSVKDGIEFLKSHDIVVHPRCKHTIDELSMYSYKVDDKTQEVLPQLDDTKNHVIDALRYALESTRRATPVAISAFAAPQVIRG